LLNPAGSGKWEPVLGQYEWYLLFDFSYLGLQIQGADHMAPQFAYEISRWEARERFSLVSRGYRETEFFKWAKILSSAYELGVADPSIFMNWAREICWF
jgi:hypothetical protein